MFSDIEKLLNLAEKAYGWVQLVKTKKQQPDALVLASAGILVSALHTLDNSFHEIVGELCSFDADWSLERREQKIKQINQFANQERILPIIRQYTEQLTKLGHDEKDRESIKKVLSCSRGVLRALGDESPVTPYHDLEELRSFLKAIKSAQKPEEIQSVIQQSEKALKVYSRSILKDADCAFGKLKGEILTRHLGSLPDPGWSNSIG